MATHPPRRLGKLPAQPARPHLRLSAVLRERLAAPPASMDWQDDRITWPMYGNDSWGDCVWAETGHAINQLTFYGSAAEVEPTDADILKGYSDVTGFNPNAGTPGNNPTDQGTYIQDAMKYWRTTGVAGHKIVAYASLDVSNLTEIKQAIALFGSISIGINFPNTAMDQFDNGQTWDIVRGAKVEGGHCVLAGAYDKDGVGIVTWGAETKMTWRFWKKYVDEAWVVLDADGMKKAGVYFTGAPSFYALGQQFTELTGETNPIPAPQPTPTPVPSPPPAPTPSPGPSLDPRLVQAFDLMQAWAHDNKVR
ncbi:hypothetical protein ACH4UM_23995 [Streptomyces sp. NPDC020801]|uniref:hypothetical protein n=1 Tax=Streptomyces sp. NPDC020801 TaxID=3365093 RepID=UPI00379F92C7